MPMSLDKFREQNPAYKDVPDDKLADGLYKKFYADKMSREDFFERVGADATQAPPTTVQERAQQTFGFDPDLDRAALLPLARTPEGEMEVAWPGIAKDMAESFMLPGHVAKGGSFDTNDATRFALDYAAPASTGARVARAGARGPAMSKREFIESAPSTDDLVNASRGVYDDVNAGGAIVAPDPYADFLARAETRLANEGVDEKLHPKLSAAFGAISKPVGQPVDIKQLQIARRQIGTALRSNEPDEKRLANILQDELDDFIDNLQPGDLVAGSADDAGRRLREARSLYSRAKKSETIEEIVEEAQRSKGASGFENRLRIGFRQLLRNKKKLRGFSPDEVALMKQIESGGTPVTRGLRLLGKMAIERGGGSNYLGATIGMAGGTAIGGPLMGAAAPIVGGLAYKGAERATSQGARLARALAAQGGKMPIGADPGGRLAAALMRAPGPVVGTQIPNRDGTL